MTRKIIDLIKNVSHISYSFEVTPDIKEVELDNLDFQPLFFSVTWHAHTHQCVNLEIAPLQLANYLVNKGKNVLLHLSCTNLKRDYLNTLLEYLIKKGIVNLFIILGENFDQNESDFTCTEELMLYIRKRTGNYFCIGVAGFPSRDDKMGHLKTKVDSGADFILTQAFFEHKIFENFVTKCRQSDINVPVIPGIFPFETNKELEGFVRLCKVDVTNDFMKICQMNSGIEAITDLISNMFKELHIKHFHLFTLNKIERIRKVLHKMNSVENEFTK